MRLVRPPLSQGVRNEIFHYIGAYIRAKYRARVQEAGTYVVAKQLRKQGIPLEVARLILL
jgi:hypothetical protein